MAAPDMTVAEIMTKRVLSVSPEHSVRAARWLMRKARVRHLPVLDDEQLLVGIVSERDLLEADDERLAMREVMKRPVCVLSPRTPLKHAARIFSERRFGAMPVLEGRRLCGIVSVVDLVRVLGE